MSDYYPEQWLSSVTNPTFIIQVADCSPDGNIAVIADGQRINTSARYLRGNYIPLGDLA